MAGMTIFEKHGTGSSTLERIQQIELEISRTQKNKVLDMAWDHRSWNYCTDCGPASYFIGTVLSDTFRYFQILSDTFRYFQILSDTFSISSVWSLNAIFWYVDTYGPMDEQASDSLMVLVPLSFLPWPMFQLCFFGELPRQGNGQTPWRVRVPSFAGHSVGLSWFQKDSGNIWQSNTAIGHVTFPLNGGWNTAGKIITGEFSSKCLIRRGCTGYIRI